MAGTGLLVNTTYTSGPNDKLAAVDVYKKPGAAVINSWQDLGAKVGLDIVGALTGSAKGSISSLIRSVTNGQVQLNPQGILDRMTGGNNALSSAFRNVSKEIQGGLTIASNLAKNVVGTVTGTVQAVASASMNDVRGIASVINAATNGSYGITFLDRGAMAGMVSSVSIQASQLGLPKVFSTLAASITDSQVLASAANLTLRFGVQSGNHSLIADVVSTVAGRQAGQLYPQAVRQLAGTVYAPDGMNRNQYPGFYSDLKGTFTNMNPGWNTYSRAGTPSIDATAVTGSTNPFLSRALRASALNAGNNNMQASLIAGTSASENLTEDKVMMCARDQMLIDGEPVVTNYLKRSYPLVSPTKFTPPVTTSNDNTGPQYLMIDGEAQVTTIKGKTYYPDKMYIDGEPVTTNPYAFQPRTNTIPDFQ